ncbi:MULTISPECIES: bifunctional hydroxymethylpyrimidine kinase/phosphomethylpyrimidine kinase [Chromohalobacter]|uniref:hydroxymethylpyrimidine kinase n=1 Tax=Chromohalobacter israelensis (strain ATCC BAA-138 / DSM 3043 / CIP 106854 / NCIMB 13768 / 1H11) TaxID=290398 RepID=Q1QST1_CHRI1|nr:MULTISPECIES: bifunctional hydroxymethylpyrimidine kinase/phosphomethylpyrimidine kinase [Chromohalobacter]ABE60477.1 hydroxymethylpyrimidine kinase / phosphomethylpyrimidine kinase [Chromohalobacter salexigens DSM 3043]MBZ5874978.1 bifunctional hydroxymethylpyrimidine kinase/phosphomethylpyrimidine kinase [Chromohalobacter salexigens]MDF9434599.1 bifunctional hydroxymethylpyrimidine kinase/phosphomethylpyrimidine kinase [Chromohalobacter israelensis]MDO0945678.1 bifunctional hydroxymethylpy
MTSASAPPNVLTIAGSDPSGGAGLQGDIKTFSALGTYATNVVTAVIAQNTQGVQAVHPVPADVIGEQLDNLLGDVRIEAVKIGMVASETVAATIRDALHRHRPRWIVLDPVMVAKSGDILVDRAGIRAVRDILVPLADVITPNLPEAAVLLDAETPRTTEAMATLLPELTRLGAPYVVLKGGHLSGANCPDLLATPQGVEWLEAPRIATDNLHGTGCALSSAVAAHLAHLPHTVSDHDAIHAAISDAKRWLHTALDASTRLAVGQGRGPVHHFHAWW